MLFDNIKDAPGFIVAANTACAGLLPSRSCTRTRQSRSAAEYFLSRLVLTVPGDHQTAARSIRTKTSTPASQARESLASPLRDPALITDALRHCARRRRTGLIDAVWITVLARAQRRQGGSRIRLMGRTVEFVLSAESRQEPQVTEDFMCCLETTTTSLCHNL